MRQHFMSLDRCECSEKEIHKTKIGSISAVKERVYSTALTDH